MYAKLWFSAGIPEKAPNTALQFLIDLCKNSTIDKKLRSAALKKLTKGHLW